jgi:hypothetical protein
MSNLGKCHMIELVELSVLGGIRKHPKRAFVAMAASDREKPEACLAYSALGKLGSGVICRCLAYKDM